MEPSSSPPIPQTLPLPVAKACDSSPRTSSTRSSSSQTLVTSPMRTAPSFSQLNPSVCGSWPAFWTANLQNWPVGGEIDIIEGVNTDTNNHVALHTTDGVIVQGPGQSGSFETTNCNVDATDQAANAGCGGRCAASDSYGDGFNSAGGGVYAMDWQSDSIRVWHFTRANIPQDI